MLARDQLGVEPLYYFVDGAKVIVSNRLGLLLSSVRSGEPDHDVICATVLERHYYHPHRTFWAKVKKVPPGHFLQLWPDGDTRLVRYWKPEKIRTVNMDFGSAVLHLRGLFITAVRVSLAQSRKSVGVHLSGGLDCSAVATLAQEQGKEIVPFTWIPLEEWSRADQKRVRLMAEKLRCAPQGTDLTSKHLAQAFSLPGRRKPFDRTLIHELPVMAKARERGLSLILSGWGGDEALTSNAHGYLPGLLANLRLVRFWRCCATNSRRWGTVKAALRALLPDRVHEILGFGGSSQPSRRSLLAASGEKRMVRLRGPRIRPLSVKGRILQVLKTGYLAARMECWAEHGDDFGIRYAYPLLDIRLVEAVLSMPEDFFWHPQYGRWLGRNVLEPFLPGSICWNQEKSEMSKVDRVSQLYPEALGLVEGIIRTQQTKYDDCLNLAEVLRILSKREPRVPGLLSALPLLDLRS